MRTAHTTDMPTDNDIIAMQDVGDQDECREAIEAAPDGPERDLVRREWWATGLCAQRPGRAQQYEDARYGNGAWTMVGHAA